MRRPALAIGTVYFLAFFAGCVGGESAGSASAGPSGGDVNLPEAPEGSTVIEGLVVDEELQPVIGALVRLDQDPPTVTNDAGRFRFVGVAPGPHVVEVQALGFIGSGRSVEAIEAETTFVQLTLAKLPVQEPYTELLLFTGFEVCGFSAGVTGATGETMRRNGVPCAFGTPSTSSRMQVNESWRYLVMEMEWQTQDTMWFFATHAPGTCGTAGPNVCWAQWMGKSPLRLEGAPNSTAHAQKYALDGKKTFPEGEFELIADSIYTGLLREEINNTAGPQCVFLIQTFLGPLGQSWNPSLGCGLGYGYSTGYKIQYYTSIFHFEAIADPAAYSARPDS